MNFEIGFWVVFSLVFGVLSCLIWLGIEKTRSDRYMQISSVGLGFLVQQYLTKCFQKVCVLLLRFQKPGIKIRLSADDITEFQKRFVDQYRSLFTSAILQFARGKEVAEQMLKSVNERDFNNLDLFVMPDTLVEKNQYYSQLLLFSSEKMLETPVEKSNEESKKYLDKLVIEFISLTNAK
jgi:hypothetical protein